MFHVTSCKKKNNSFWIPGDLLVTRRLGHFQVLTCFSLSISREQVYSHPGLPSHSDCRSGLETHCWLISFRRDTTGGLFGSQGPSLWVFNCNGEGWEMWVLMSWLFLYLSCAFYCVFNVFKLFMDENNRLPHNFLWINNMPCNSTCFNWTQPYLT